jgi:hypothetical protein
MRAPQGCGPDQSPYPRPHLLLREMCVGIGIVLSRPGARGHARAGRPRYRIGARSRAQGEAASRLPRDPARDHECWTARTQITKIALFAIFIAWPLGSMRLQPDAGNLGQSLSWISPSGEVGANRVSYIALRGIASIGERHDWRPAFPARMWALWPVR